MVEGQPSIFPGVREREASVMLPSALRRNWEVFQEIILISCQVTSKGTKKYFSKCAGDTSMACDSYKSTEAAGSLSQYNYTSASTAGTAESTREHSPSKKGKQKEASQLGLAREATKTILAALQRRVSIRYCSK